MTASAGTRRSERYPQTSIRANLKLSYWDAFLFGAMISVGETYFPALALEIRGQETDAAAIAVYPMAIAAFVQLGTYRIYQKCTSTKSWILGCAVSQILALFFLAFFWSLGWLNFYLLLLLSTVYWIGTLASTPAWNFWVSETVPAVVRTSFLSKRRWISHCGILVGLVVAGFTLHFWSLNTSSSFGSDTANSFGSDH